MAENNTAAVAADNGGTVHMRVEKELSFLEADTDRISMCLDRDDHQGGVLCLTASDSNAIVQFLDGHPRIEHLFLLCTVHEGEATELWTQFFAATTQIVCVEVYGDNTDAGDGGGNAVRDASFLKALGQGLMRRTQQQQKKDMELKELRLFDFDFQLSEEQNTTPFREALRSVLEHATGLQKLSFVNCNFGHDISLVLHGLNRKNPDLQSFCWDLKDVSAAAPPLEQGAGEREAFEEHQRRVNEHQDEIMFQLMHVLDQQAPNLRHLALRNCIVGTKCWHEILALMQQKTRPLKHLDFRATTKVLPQEDKLHWKEQILHAMSQNTALQIFQCNTTRLNSDFWDHQLKPHLQRNQLLAKVQHFLNDAQTKKLGTTEERSIFGCMLTALAQPKLVKATNKPDGKERKEDEENAKLLQRQQPSWVTPLYVAVSVWARTLASQSMSRVRPCPSAAQ